MTSQPVFAGRGQELLRLTSHLERALAGRGQLCFITGAAGRGKTALALEFARRAQAARSDLIFAAGAGDFMTGRGHPYHPFRTILQTLTGAGPLQTLQRGQTARLRRLTEYATAYMLDWGRELFEVFLPSTRPGSADGSVGDAAARPILPPALLFQQYTNVLHKLAEKTPLLLLVDDVQWADRSSLDLLLHLASRLDSCRILLLVTLPAVSAAEAQPQLHTLLAAARQRHDDAIIDLEQSDSRAWLDAYLDSMPNRLEGPWRQALWRHTEGNPLAVSQLVAIMQTEEVLTRDDYGVWVAAGTTPWSQLPGHVEAVVHSVLERLPPAVRRTLQAASVQGQAFIAEAVAQVLGLETTAVLEHLSHDLVQRCRLVEPIRRTRINGRKLAHFTFGHHLFTQRLLSSVPVAERPRLHAATAQALAGLYGAEAQTFEAALALTWHTVRAGLAAQAQPGLRWLSERAMASVRYAAASGSALQAMALGAATAEATVPLLLARETVYRCQGDQAAQRGDLALLAQLAAEVEDPLCQIDILLRQAQAACTDGAAAEGLQAANAALELVQTAIAGDDLLRQALASRWQGEALLRQGDYAAAVAALQAAQTAAQAAGAAHLEADLLRTLGACQAHVGHYEASRAYYEHALRLCHQIGYRTGEMASRHGRSTVLLRQGRIDLAREAYSKTLTFCRRIGDQVGEAYALLSMAAQDITLGRDAEAAEAAANALALSRQIDAPGMVAHALVLLSIARRRLQDDPQTVVAYAQTALDIGRSLEEWPIERAALLALADGWTWAGKYVKAQETYWQALDAARHAAGGDDELMLFALSGLVELALAGDAAELAATHAAAIRRLLSAQSAATLDTLARPTLAAYRALADRDAEAAAALLVEGYQRLLAGAERILDSALRESYLQNIAHHRALTAIVQTLMSSAAVPAADAEEPGPALAADPDVLANGAEAAVAPPSNTRGDHPDDVRPSAWWRRPKLRLRWWPAPAMLLLAVLLGALLRSSSALPGQAAPETAIVGVLVGEMVR